MTIERNLRVMPAMAHHRGDGCIPPMRAPAHFSPLSLDQIAAIAERVQQVIDDGGFGEVSIVIENGAVHAFRVTTSQLFLDELIHKRHGR